MLWHAVVQLIWATLVKKTPSLICSHSLIIHVYLMFPYTESSFILISHWFTLSNVMSINSYYAIISQYEWMAETRIFLYHTQTHTHWSAWRLNEGHKHTNNNPQNCSESPLMGVSPFYLSKFILISYTRTNIKVFTATCQNKSQFFLRQRRRNICSAECTHYY